MINFDEELKKIFGDKYQGCTQTGDGLVEYSLKPGETATVDELAQIDALPKGLRLELDEVKAQLFGTGTTPPLSTHISILVAVDTTKARPAKVKRVWQGQDYYYDCFATQTVKDEYVAGMIVIGDYVLVHFDEVGEQIVTAKVFKSW